MDFLRAAKRERVEDIETQPEESPVGEHQSNGDIERAVQTIEGQIRSMILALESRCKSKIRQDHPIFPWLIRHSAILINIAKVGDDGKTAYERRKGKKFLRSIPEIGECIWFLRPESVGKDKLDTRWENGIFVGLREESGEIFVSNEQGVIKIRSYLQRPKGREMESRTVRPI